MATILSTQLLFAALVLASIYVLIAIGLNLVYGTMRLLNVAHGELMMLGGYVSFWSFSLLGVGTIFSMFGAMATTAALGCLFYLLFLRFLLANPAYAARLEANSMIVFFALSIIMQNLMALGFGANPRSYTYFNGIVTLFDGRIQMNRIIIIGVGMTVAGACILFFRRSWLGLAARALIQQRDAAALIGIDADRVNIVVFCIGFGLAGLAGSLVSMTEAITPFGGFSYTIAAFVIIILGGLGNLAGSIVGAVLLAFIEVYGSALSSAAYRSILVYAAFVLIIWLRPQGLLGRKAA